MGIICLYGTHKKLIYFIQTFRRFRARGAKDISSNMSSGWHRNIHILELFCLCAFHANRARGLIYEFVGMVSTMTNKLLFAEIHNNNAIPLSSQWDVIILYYASLCFIVHSDGSFLLRITVVTSMLCVVSCGALWFFSALTVSDVTLNTIVQ